MGLPTFHAGDKLHPLPILVNREGSKKLVQFVIGVKHLCGNAPYVAVVCDGFFCYPAESLQREMGEEAAVCTSYTKREEQPVASYVAMREKLALFPAHSNLLSS